MPTNLHENHNPSSVAMYLSGVQGQDVTIARGIPLEDKKRMQAMFPYVT